MKVRLLLFTLVLISFSSSYGQVVKNGIVGYWPFNNNADDLTANKNHGKVTGATLTKDRYGNANSAYYFDGSGDYIDLGSSSTLFPRNLTLSFWIKHDGTQANMSLVNCHNGNNGEWGVVSVIQNNTNGFVSGIGAGSNNHAMSFISYNKLDDDQWHMVTIYFDSKNNTKLGVYIDGCFAGYNNWSGSSGGFSGADVLTYDGTTHWYVGAAAQFFASKVNNGPQYFEGAIDDIALYDRVLTDMEIKMMYACQSVVVYDTVKVYDTIPLAVTDTLIMNLKNLSSTAPNPCGVKIYPNPTDNLLYINNSSACLSAGYQIKIVDNVGKTVYNSGITTSVQTVTLKDFANSGMYFVEITNSTGILLDRKKILVQ